MLQHKSPVRFESVRSTRIHVCELKVRVHSMHIEYIIAQLFEYGLGEVKLPHERQGLDGLKQRIKIAPKTLCISAL